jgi:hypothetical protein
MEIFKFQSDPTYRIPTIQTDYYAIPLGEFMKAGTHGTIIYNYVGKANTPNVVYASSNNAMGNFPLGYQATELFVCPTDEAMKSTFPFLRHQAQLSVLNGAMVVVHRPLTNGVPLYTVFLLEPAKQKQFVDAALDIQPLLNPSDTTKKAYQNESMTLAIQEFIDQQSEGTFVVYEDEKDGNGQTCIVAVFTVPLLVKPVQVVEGFDGTIPKADDPNYTYQECTMVPVDGIYDDGSGNIQYTYQVSSDSQIVSSNMENVTVFNISGILLYFIITIAIFFGTPLIYNTIMCNILAKIGQNKSKFVDYLYGSQNFFGMGEYRGLTIIFNILYVLLIASFWIAGSASKDSTNEWSLYSMVAFFVLAWVIGYMGVKSRPLPPSC